MTARLLRAGLAYTIRFHHWLPKVLGADATTVGATICVKDGTCPPDLHAHEFTHVQQYARDGVLWFLCRYLWQRCLVGYRRIDYEVEAYRAGSDPAYVATFPAVTP
jgi:hypothetical protein